MTLGPIVEVDVTWRTVYLLPQPSFDISQTAVIDLIEYSHNSFNF